MYKWSPDSNNRIWIDAAHGFGTPGEKIIVEESGYKPKIEQGGIKRALDWANDRLKEK